MTWLQSAATALLLAAPTVVVARQVEDGARELLTTERIGALPGRDRDAWTSYIATSRRPHALDTASMNAELRAAGRTEMMQATYSAPDMRTEMLRIAAVRAAAAWFRANAIHVGRAPGARRARARYRTCSSSQIVTAVRRR